MLTLVVPPSEFNGTAPTGPVNWSALRAEITARLNIRREFAALGVEFTDSSWTDPQGSVHHECYGPDREEAGRSIASAVVYSASGLLHDSGSGEKAIHLIDFALKRGRFGRWIDAFKHYAELAGVPIPSHKTQSGGRILEATYDYAECDGTVRYRVYRYIMPNGAKTFTQHPIGRNGSVVFDKGAMSGVAPLPYRLGDLPCGEWGDANETADANNSPSASTIFVTEGEKAADALVAIGLVASTAHGGSGAAAKNWPIVATYFRGLDVVFLPDNDKAGREVAAVACRSLRDAGVASVRCLALPGLPVKGDAVEWIADGGTREQLEALADACPVWSPEMVAEGVECETIEPINPDDDATAEDLANVMSDDAWLWKGWIPNAALTLLAAEGGRGKTRFLMDLHKRLYNGLPWPDGTWPKNPVDQPKVLWVAGDRQFREFRDIPPAFGFPRDRVILNSTKKDPFGGRLLESVAQWDDLEARIERQRPVFVSIDTITKTGHFKSQDPVDAAKQYGPLMDISVRQQVPIICVTHLSKGGTALGVRAAESVRTVIQLTRPDRNQEHRRRLWVEKSFDEIPPVLGITMGREGNEYDLNPPEQPEEGATFKAAPKAPTPAVLKVAEWLTTTIGTQTLRVKPIRQASDDKGWGAKTLYAARDHLKIVETEDENGHKFWSLPRSA